MRASREKELLFKSKESDMTEGNILQHLWRFAVPLVLGNLFQQLYNTVDVWVLGNFATDEAFSAVGTVTPIINTFIGGFTGLASGAGAVISQYFGAKNDEKVRNTVCTALLLTILLSAIFMFAGVNLTPTMLRIAKTPEDVFPESQTYLTIYFAGVAGLLFYNMGAAILRAVGNSVRPFMNLVIAAAINVALDLLLVIHFHMGVWGVAYATIFAQGVSALLTIAAILREESSVKVSLKHICFDYKCLKRILSYGFPACVQMSVVCFSNVFIQSYINQFGKQVMGGWTAYHKMDQLIFLPMQSLSISAATFTGQNLGIGNEQRAREGTMTAVLMCVGITGGLSVVVAIFAPVLSGFFNSNPEIISYGTLLMRWLTPFYFLNGVQQVFVGALRGAGKTKVPMLILLGNFVLFRQAYLFFVSRVANRLIPLAMGYPVSWLLCSIIIIYYYRHTDITNVVNTLS